MTFQNFGLIPELLRAVSDSGYTTPSPIQQKSIPIILEQFDVIGLAQTGTGKTAAFTLPLLQLLHASHDPNKTIRQPRGLILAPTRELSAQIGESVREYGRHLSLRSEIIFGGVNINPQIRKLRQGTDIIVATPGRLLDLVTQRVVNLSKVEILVLDEADRMLDMGFIHDIKKILALLPKQRQNLLFSATLSPGIQSLANSILKNHKVVEVAPRNVTTELVNQVVYKVDQKRKRELLSYLIGFNNWQQVLVFTRTKHHANKLCEQLIEDGLPAAALHGNKSQGARTKALEQFKTGKIRVLVATDIAARGLDIEQLPYVVNFELPNVAEDYVHRIGRTGRAGMPGNAVSLVCIDELHLLRDIEKLTKKTIATEILPGYEPDRNVKAQPINMRHNKSRVQRFVPKSSEESTNRTSKYSARSGTSKNKPSVRTKPTHRSTDNRRNVWKADDRKAYRGSV
jgi:ATP-dependent RNA helicase RhlE